MTYRFTVSIASLLAFVSPITTAAAQNKRGAIGGSHVTPVYFPG